VRAAAVVGAFGQRTANVDLRLQHTQQHDHLLPLGRRRAVDLLQPALGNERLVLGQQRCEDEATEHQPFGPRRRLAGRQQTRFACGRLDMELHGLATALHSVLDQRAKGRTLHTVAQADTHRGCLGQHDRAVGGNGHAVDGEEHVAVLQNARASRVGAELGEEHAALLALGGARRQPQMHAQLGILERLDAVVVDRFAQVAVAGGR
jgi:hypothetical protein